MAKKTIKITAQKGPQWDFLGTEADICIYGGAAGGGKAMPLSEPVLTTRGFIPMGRVRIGTEVRTPDNGTAKVIQIHPQGVVDTYRIRFSDGAETVCTADHLWMSRVSRVPDSDKVRTTAEIKRLIDVERKNVFIPLCSPIEFDREVELPIKPYMLGVLIGDGYLCRYTITITKGDMEVFDRIREDGYSLTNYCGNHPERTPEYGVKDFKEEKKWLTEKKLRCKGYKKYIPNEYKYASIQDRIDLIQGLMDTDGYADKHGNCSFSTTSKRLANDVQWIIRSLGGRAKITSKIPSYTRKDGTKKKCRRAYIVHVRMPDNSILFSLPRKKKRCEVTYKRKHPQGQGRRIASILWDGEKECQCITLDNEQGLYLTRDFIVTHNSYGLLLSPLMYKGVRGFNAVVFRRTFKQIFSPGSLWDMAHEIYSLIPNAQMRKVAASWEFVDKAGDVISKVTFAHIENYSAVDDWKGSQLCEICFDEVTHFGEDTFFYMLSRNRSTCGVKPFVRATCNPDADSWVAKFIEWWIDQDTGYPIQERSGKLRWFVRRDGIINWADTKEELWERFNLQTPEERDEPRSVTFIMSSIYDNKELLKVNPQYLSSLKALPEVERERLLKGNWKIKSTAGTYFKRTQIELVLDEPSDIQQYCRAWDLAASSDKESGDPDYTAGVLAGLRKDKSVVILDVINKRVPASDVERLIYNTAVADRKKYGLKCKIRIPQDPGAAGKIVAQNYIKILSGFPVKAIPVSGSKELRATPVAAQWQVGNIYVLAAEWNDMYFTQLESFPQGAHDDMVDATSDAFNELSKPTFELKNLL